MYVSNMAIVCLSCFLFVLVDVNTPLLVHSSTLLSQHGPTSMATSEKQNNLRTTWILPQAESEKTQGLRSSLEI